MPYIEKSEIVVKVPVTYEVTEYSKVDVLQMLRTHLALAADDILEMNLTIYETEDEDGWDKQVAHFDHLKVKRLVKTSNRMDALNK